MKKRFKMSKRFSRKNFKKGTRVRGRNFAGAPMRGGIRL